MTHSLIIDNEVLYTLKDINIMDINTYVSDATNHLASQTQETCVDLGVVQINKIQDLIWWIYNDQNNGIAPDKGFSLLMFCITN